VSKTNGKAMPLALLKMKRKKALYAGKLEILKFIAKFAFIA